MKSGSFSAFLQTEKKIAETICYFGKFNVLCRPKNKTYYKRIVMSRVCQITGKGMIVGNKVSHSNIKTKRRFYPNLQVKKFYIPEEDRWVTLKVSAAGIRNISKNGISASLKTAQEKGYL